MVLEDITDVFEVEVDITEILAVVVEALKKVVAFLVEEITEVVAVVV
jgi:hypothetical protein